MISVDLLKSLITAVLEPSFNQLPGYRLAPFPLRGHTAPYGHERQRQTGDKKQHKDLRLRPKCKTIFSPERIKKNFDSTDLANIEPTIGVARPQSTERRGSS